MRSSCGPAPRALKRTKRAMLSRYVLLVSLHPLMTPS